MSVGLPEIVRQRALANGAAGQQWLDELPGTLDLLANEWQIDIGEVMSGGTAGFVAGAKQSNGQDCVLKVTMPLDMHEADAFRRSVRAHELAQGRGCVRLLASDTTRSAMLMERLGPNLDELGFDVPQILDAVASTLKTFWRPLDEHERIELPSGRESATWLADYIVTTWEELQQPCSRSVIDQAVAYCQDRADAFDPTDAVLVHGDAHGWNTVQDSHGLFKFVDPEGLHADRAQDLAVPMREYNEPLLDGDTLRLTRARSDYLAAVCDVDPVAVWQWGFIERVSTGLANLRDVGHEGTTFLAVAEQCLEPTS